jgi:hypothetical protein
MKQHIHLRAYMAGIVVPTLFLLLAMTAFTLARYVFDVPLQIERVIVFPMAIVPNLWGVWNIVWISTRRSIPIGLFGAILPFVLLPGAYLVTRMVGFALPPGVPKALPFLFPVAVAIYYLAWKHLVAALNRIVGVA